MAFRRGLFFWMSVILLTSCSSTKSLPEGEKLYTGATVKMSGSGLPVRKRKVLKSDLQGLTRPKPNSKVLGLPIKLYIYNSFAKKKKKSLFGKLRDKYGQPPVLLSSVDLENNVKILQNFLENKGYFRAKVTGDTVVKKKKGSAVYDVETGEQYTIANVQFPTDSITLATAISETAKETLLKKGEPYDLDLIKGERTRIDAAVKEKGYYFFSPDYLLAQVDSISDNHTVDMRLVVKPETPDQAKFAYRINNVYIYSGYNLNTANLDTNKAAAKFYEGYYVIDRRNRFKPKLFSQIMRFSPGDLYNRTDHNLTLNRLINLNEFRYVKNRFEPVPDSAKLDTYYYLTPLPRQSLRAEVTATNKTNNFNGTQLTVNYRNRNRFRAGEQLSISAYVGTEVGIGSNYKGYNTYRSGAEVNFAIPRFVVPFFHFNTKGGFVPRTNIQLGYDVMNRRKLYTINSYRAGLGYLWRESQTKQHEFYPISINYTQPLNITQEFLDSINQPGRQYLRHVVDSQFVIGSTYQYNYNQLAAGVQKINSFYFNGLVDLSGNVAGLLTGANQSSGKESRILGARFNQYIKLEADGRYYRKLGLKSTWANRVIIGYGNPYGNSSELPYIKQFFSGGNNSVRAFRARTLGPGSFRDLKADSASGFYPDQTGDIKLEFNTEFRPHLYGPIYGALFIDAGNVWLKNADPDRPGAKFGKDFLKQLAVGAGAGIRVDIQLFVIRLDVAFPLRKPWESPPSQFNSIEFNHKKYRSENIVYNLAIGYPF